MFSRVLQFLTGCRHRKISKPFTATPPAVSTGTSGEWGSVPQGVSHYVVCLDCGRKFRYDWSTMRVLW